MKSLHALERPMGKASAQLQLLSDTARAGIPAFDARLQEIDLFPLQATGIEIFQMNLGKMCNQTCKHCHVDAGPDRKEIMTRETMQLCLDALDQSAIHTVDLTGGAPEMNPEFRWLVKELSARGKKIIVRCNLTIIVANPKYHDLPQFYKENGVEVVSSLPYFSARRTDAQRGEGVFEKSIRALKMLNDQGYGRSYEHQLNLVYNPTGSFLPGDQTALESEFKRRLKQGFDIDFDALFVITNLPVSRFLEYLLSSGQYEHYMQSLAENFNPGAAQSAMCRNTISIGWDGFLYDCDFNQMLEMTIEQPNAAHIRDFDVKKLSNRTIKTNQHCYGCTAGAGSSCGGAIT